MRTEPVVRSLLSLAELAALGGRTGGRAVASRPPVRDVGNGEVIFSCRDATVFREPGRAHTGL